MIAERLKAARESRGLSQQALADQTGVSLRSQQNYEAGSRSPDSEYFELLASLGIDVLFVLTGEINSSALSADEAMLVQMYRAATPATKGAALGALLGAQQGIDQVINSLSSREVQIPAVDKANAATPKPARKRATKTSK